MRLPPLVFTAALAGLMLSACPAARAACATAAALVQAPPASVPPGLLNRYPDGFTAAATVAVDAEGAVRSVDVTSEDASVAAVRNTVVAWARRATYSPACHAALGRVTLDDLRFYPPSSGVLGRPPTVAGLNFFEFTYVDTARNNKVIRFSNGVYTDAQGDLPSTIDIEDVFAGRLSGAQIAVVVQRGEGPGGYDAWATAYAVADGKARRLAVLGDYSFFTTGEGPYPRRWFALRFSQDRLYADVWQYANRCKPRADWLATTYAVRAGSLHALNVMRHHRAGAPVPRPRRSDPSACSYDR